MPRPKPAVLEAMCKDLRMAAHLVETAKNSDHLLDPAKLVAQVNNELLQVREYWRSRSETRTGP